MRTPLPFAVTCSPSPVGTSWYYRATSRERREHPLKPAFHFPFIAALDLLNFFFLLLLALITREDTESLLFIDLAEKLQRIQRHSMTRQFKNLDDKMNPITRSSGPVNRQTLRKTSGTCHIRR